MCVIVGVLFFVSMGVSVVVVVGFVEVMGVFRGCCVDCWEGVVVVVVGGVRGVVFVIGCSVVSGFCFVVVCVSIWLRLSWVSWGLLSFF